MKRTFIHRLAALSCVVILGSCTPNVIPQTAPVIAAPPAQQPVATPPPAAQRTDFDGWRDWAASPGNWGYSTDEIGSIARFTAPDGAVRAMIRCSNKDGLIFISLAGSSTDAAKMQLRTTSGSKTFATRPTSGDGAFVYATIQPRDEILDFIAYSRGKFLIAVDDGGNAPALAHSLPAWPETGRVIEDCR